MAVLRGLQLAGWAIAQHAASGRAACQYVSQSLGTRLILPSSGSVLSPGHMQHLQGRRHMSISLPSPLHLDEVMRLPLLEDKTTEEIEQIWLQHHASGPATRTASTMSWQEWSTLSARAKASPWFVLPLAKPNGGYQTMVLQWQPPVALVTGLADYKAAGANATPHLAITHYAELGPSKGLVLLLADVIADAQLSVPEARTCVELIRAFYTDPESYQAVYQFNHDPDKFSFDNLLQLLGLSGTAGANGGTAADAS